MQVQIHPTFIYPSLFLISSRAAATGFPPGEVIGVLIVKQTIGANGMTPLPRDQQRTIELKDVTYIPYPPENPGITLAIKLESDLASFKPFLDVAAVRDNSARGFFGHIRINRGTGFEPNPPDRLSYGWLNRAADNEPNTVEPRKSLAGDAGGFQPDVNDKFKLPNGFQNKFFNGSPLRADNGNPFTPVHLQAGNQVEFGSVSQQVTIPAGPSLAFQVDGIAIQPPVIVDRHVDTVVYQQTEDIYLVTWRAIFAWESRLENAVLLVN